MGSKADWAARTRAELKGRDPDTLAWATLEGIAVQPVYGPEDTAHRPDPGYPGAAPFRGACS
jgi:methylmalonyl-CoA mutase